jgi:hypothetical protein
MGEHYLLKEFVFIAVHFEVQAGKKYLPLAISYAKRYYQKRKHNKMIYNDVSGRYNDPPCKSI